jgi:hypothetical protein
VSRFSSKRFEGIKGSACWIVKWWKKNILKKETRMMGFRFHSSIINSGPKKGFLICKLFKGL